MSFTGTPLGQGRPLDHHTFLNNNNSNRPLSPPQRIVPLSYTNGAPTLGATTPSSPTRDRTNSSTDEIDPNEPALARFARLKQREQSTNTRKNRSGVFTSPPKPEKWSVKDTSVNIATAFHQAATAFDMPSNNPNNSWASGRPTSNVPRSTSVEYEKDTQSTAVRRLAAPPNRLAVPRSTTRKPLSKTVSVRHVPDSEGEEDPEPVNENGRGKSPLEQVVDLTKRALAPATFYLRQRSQEPEAPPKPTNGRDTSYDYAAEEAEYQATQNQNQPPASRRGNPTHKRNRMSTDNKAYRPSASDLEEEDEDFDDDGKKGRRRKKKKDPPGGPLMTLPVTSYDKKKRRKSKGSKGNMAEMEEDDRSESEENVTEQYLAHQHASLPRESPAVSIPHGSVPPQYGLRERPEDISVDVEQGLASIPEAHDDGNNVHPDSLPSQPSFSIGAFLGKCVHWLYKCVASVVVGLLQFVAMLFFILGRVLGTMFDVVFNRPAQWIGGVRSGTVVQLGKYIIVVGIIYAAWYILQETPIPWIPIRPWGSHPPYTAPDIPPADIAELSARLRTMEVALSGLAQEHDSARLRMEGETRGRIELGGRIGSIETRLQRENARVAEAEAQVRQLVNQGLPGLRQEMEILLEQVRTQGSQEVAGSDEEARAKLKVLEERVDGVEGGVKEALEVGRSAAKAGGTVSNLAWWKLATGSVGAGLTIKAADGQDMTSLVGHLVDTAVSKYGKDVLARPDFALHSSGARIIPSLTSPTFEMSPPTLRGQIVGLITGNGYAIGRPPITALHHELHSGHCWPFAGSEGQLGVALAAPTFISDVTIDHVAKEVAFDMRSAPRQMELWGMVEGRDNIARVREWQAEKARRRKEAGVPLDDEEPVYPRTLPNSPQYIRIVSFSYDIHAPSNIQTFPVTQEIRDLGVDFGIVVLMVKSNWGRSDFSCLYRLRVHGQQLLEPPLPEASK